MMQRRRLDLILAVLLSTAALFGLFRWTDDDAGASAAPLAGDPVVSEVAPASAPNDGAIALEITGTGFTATVSGTAVLTPPGVLLDRTALPEVGWVASTTLTATVPAGFPVGVYTVTVENPDGARGALPEALTVRYPAPEVGSVDPVSGTYGEAGVLTIRGAAFAATPTVSLGGAPCPAVGFVSSTTLTATVPGGLLPGIHDLEVRNPGPERPQDGLPDAFTLYSPEPTVTGIEPIEGPNDLDIAVAITGTQFVPTPTAALGETPLGDVTWVSATRLTAEVPWGMDPVSYSLSLTNPGPGAPTADLPDAFTVTKGINTWNAGELYGGSVQWLLVNPVTPTTLYAASAHAGLFRSRDGGDHWSFQLAGGADYPAIDPDAPDRLYVFGAGGLERSEDAGETWATLEPTFPYTDRSGDRCSTSSIIPYVHPDLGTVYALACHADYQGLIKSDDHGDTWTSISEGITDTQITALAFHPGDPQIMYAGTGHGHIFVSSNGGATWTHAAQPVGCVGALAVNPSGEHELWVASDDSFGDPCVLRKSTGADLTAWETLTGTDEGCFWPRPAIDFASQFPGTALVSGFGFSGLKTTDGGASWKELYPGGGALVNGVAFDPTQSETLYLADKWEGIYKTTDGGNDWTVSHEGLTALYPLEMAAHPARPDVVYARLNSEELYKGTRGGEIWERLPISRVASVQIDPITPTRIYAGRSGDPAYIYVSDDEGRTWTPSAPLPQAAGCDGWSFPWALLALPEHPGTLLAGVQHYCDHLPHPGNIYRSTDFGASWQSVNAHAYDAYSFMDFAYDPMRPTTIYAANPSGEDGLLKSTDGGATWDSLGIEHVPAVEVEPGTHHVFIPSHSACGGQESSLCRSTDGGEQWESVGDDSMGIDEFKFAPETPSLIYAGTDGGLLKSTNGGQTWRAAAGGLGSVPIYALEMVTDTDRLFLYAGTTGGRAGGAGAQAMGTARAGDLVNAGVYRYTSRSLKVYLPLVLRGFAP